MVKKRKSIRKPPTVVIIEGEEQLFESADANEPDTLVPVAEAGEMAVEEQAEQDSRTIDPDEEVEESEEDARAREKALEEWNAFKEEYHEIIEQLPLSLYRSMALLRELDDQVHESHAAILPAIRAYVALRMSIAGKATPPLGHEPEAMQVDGQNTVSAAVGTPGKLSIITSHAADGLGEGSSPKSVSDELQVVVAVEGQTPVLAPAPESALSSKAPSAAPLPLPSFLRPPNPFALKRSHSSFALLTQKIQEESPPSTREMLIKIAWLSAQTVKASEEKLGVATAAYNSVDRHVRSLDAAIKEHENSLVFGMRAGTRPGAGMQSFTDGAVMAAGDDGDDGGPQFTIGFTGETKSHKSKRETEREKKRQKERERKERKRREASEAAARVTPPLGAGEDDGPVVPVPETPSSVARLGMPVDPHEPRYCYCRQVSYGEMIGCDNENCANEWFHLGCVGLTEAPKGDKKWYCRDCAKQFERPSKKRRT